MQRLFAAMDKNGGQLTDNNLLKIARAMVQAGQMTEEMYGRLTRSMTQQAGLMKTKADNIVSALTEVKSRSYDEAGVKDAVTKLTESGQISASVLFDLQQALDDNAEKAKLAKQAYTEAADAGDRAAKAANESAAANL
jgi:Ca2+-binding EF-hand superfamily protein